MDIDLRGAPHLKFIGTATSHFQAEPLMDDLATTPVLDWELEVMNRVMGRPSHIKHRQYLQDLPHLLEKKELYAKRSLELGMNMFRFSFELGRLSPKIGEFNEGLMARYVGLLALLKSQGQEPMVTLQHYTMPLSLCSHASGGFEAGAWEHPEVINYLRYVMERIIGFMSDQDKVRWAIRNAGIPREYIEGLIQNGFVSRFITINEPIMTPLQGYISGLYPPFKKGSLSKAKRVLKRMVEAHDLMYDLIKEPSATQCVITFPCVGVAYNWSYLDGAFGFAFQKVLNEFWYTDRFERDGSHSDFLGIQYYFRETPPFFGKKWRSRTYSQHKGFGDICPRGMTEVLRRMHHAYPKKAIFVTEFGFPDATDWKRPHWIMRTFLRVLEAVREGIPVQGMLHWSLADNFEWDQGMNKKFGLASEAELERPLSRHDDDQRLIRGWQAWKACADTVLRPSTRAQQVFENAYKMAAAQYGGSNSKQK